MDNDIKYMINRIYYEKDYEYFAVKSSKDLILPRAFYDILSKPGLTVNEWNSKVNPSRAWTIRYKAYQKGIFKVRYITTLLISKLVDCYYIQHEFGVENQDINQMTPVLDGFGCQAYTQDQEILRNDLSEILSEVGYRELSYAEVNEAILGLSYPEGVTIFGPQVIVERAIFYDFLGLSNSDKG